MWSAVKDRSMFLNIRVKSLARLQRKRAWILIVYMCLIGMKVADKDVIVTWVLSL